MFTRYFIYSKTSAFTHFQSCKYDQMQVSKKKWFSTCYCSCSICWDWARLTGLDWGGELDMWSCNNKIKSVLKNKTKLFKRDTSLITHKSMGKIVRKRFHEHMIFEKQKPTYFIPIYTRISRKKHTKGIVRWIILINQKLETLRQRS